MTGPTNDKKETTWGGLAKEVRYWGEWVLKKVKAEIGDLYPFIPDPAHTSKRENQKAIFGTTDEVQVCWVRCVAPVDLPCLLLPTSGQELTHQLCWSTSRAAAPSKRQPRTPSRPAGATSR